MMLGHVRVFNLLRLINTDYDKADAGFLGWNREMRGY